MKKMMNRWLAVILLLLLCLLPGCESIGNENSTEEISVTPGGTVGVSTSFSLSDVPEYSGDPYVAINDNEPDFTADELTTESYESYSELDELGRCQTAEANIGQDLMPTEKRGSIGQIKPTGWKTTEYDSVQGSYLYNRCHLIAYELTAENANEKNLITGTRYMNVSGMLPFENMVADYIKETGNHVLYRVTPVFEGDNLIASGVHMEAMSVEDDGDGICYNVYVYNVQPGIEIDYSNGDSWESEDTTEDSGDEVKTYVLNTHRKKFHLEFCASVAQMSEENKEVFVGTRQDLIDEGYSACGSCGP